MIDGASDQRADLPEDVKRQLLRCEGYLDLKMADHAERELRAVDADYRAHIHFRWLTLGLLMLREYWEDALALVKELREEKPLEAGLWIQEAFITRRATGSIEEARDLLETALNAFPEEALIYYNLGCYACQIGHHEEAVQRLKSAIDLDERWLQAALNDDDYEPLRDEIEGWL